MFSGRRENKSKTKRKDGARNLRDVSVVEGETPKIELSEDGKRLRSSGLPKNIRNFERMGTYCHSVVSETDWQNIYLRLLYHEGIPLW
jgi:hypothetical protein